MSHIVFTLDFHEMVRGTLKKGGTCTINYDPLRLVTAKEGYIHGGSAYEFTAHVKFEPQGNIDVPLISETGMLENPVALANGRGTMLTGDFTIPNDAEEIITWISLKDDKGEYFYDSDFGCNFHFRLFIEDIKVTKAVVENSKTTGTAKFVLNATTATAVDKVIVRYRVMNGPDPLTEVPVELQPAKGKKNQLAWTTGDVEVPFDSVVIYDIIYIVDGKKFKVENNGNYFIAHTS